MAKHKKGHKKGIVVNEEAFTKLNIDELAKKKGNIFIGTLNVAAQPGKLITEPAKKIYKKSYHGKRFAKTWFIIDIIILGFILAALGAILWLTVFKPSAIIDLVNVHATVAPKEVVSGASSTLVINYQNNSGEVLEHASLSLQFPAYFELQEIQTNSEEIGTQLFDLGTLNPGDNGNIKIRGVMFGDVGGEQTFTTALNFIHGKRKKAATKVSEHTFSPVRSTLVLELKLPDRLVEGSIATGIITYKNTGEIDFPEITIEPIWPDDFVLTDSDPALIDGRFRLTALEAGAEGQMEFTGRMPAGDSVDFEFHPTFTFQDDHFVQETLRKNIPLLPSQISVRVTAPNVLLPGQTAEFEVAYEHVGEFSVEDVVVTLNGVSPYFSTSEFTTEVGKLEPGESDTFTVKIPISRFIRSSETSVYENLRATVESNVSYVLPDGIDSSIESFLGSVEIPVASQVILESFGRYASPQGDQLGRGPLPPYVGEETKYWVFMTITGTTAELSNVKLEADLGANVQFTGKQSVSVGNAVSYNVSQHSVNWSIGSIGPTLSPGSTIISVAFELAITPTEDMVGTTPVLMSRPLITGTDTNTGVFVTASGATVTTDLPHDSMAAGFGTVEK